MPEQDLSRLPITRLKADIASLAADLERRLERWLALVAEFDRRGAAREAGFRGTAEWLAWRCGLKQRTARDHVRVARALAERPVIRDALISGELSYSKVRALSRAPAWESEAGLVDLARASTAGEVERVVRALRSAHSADLDVANAAHARRFVDWSWDPDGSLSIRGRLTADDGAAFIEMLETAAAALHGASARREPATAAFVEDVTMAEQAAWRPPLGARRADALAEIARSGVPRAQVVLRVDEPALACVATGAAEREGETCEIEHGPAIPSETARRLACDADVVVARCMEDGTMDYGRARRVVPAPLRTAIERRDRGCRFPGCECAHDLHAHHVVHWAHGGTTSKDNLVLLCRFHHRLVHEGGFSVARTSDGAHEFRGHDRRPIPRAPARGDPLAA